MTWWALGLLGAALAAEGSHETPSEVVEPVAVEGNERPQRPLRAVAWIAAEEGALFVIDGWIARPAGWGPPAGAQFVQAFAQPPLFTDDDAFWVNFVLHPLMGSHFYMTARNHGLPVPVAVLYAVTGSLAWEFLVESWYTRPVVLDAIATPLLGVPLGLVFDELKKPLRRIRPRGWRGLALLPVDPIEATDVWLFNGGRHRSPEKTAERLEKYGEQHQGGAGVEGRTDLPLLSEQEGGEGHGVDRLEVDGELGGERGEVPQSDQRQRVRH